ncbi:hypothetical protein F4806DRAFT_492303 [Annulohypoxylon nitens]|nr:hypothetical protein F4806DRAFT_492303 [Annulohypoxylon nitens]
MVNMWNATNKLSSSSLVLEDEAFRALKQLRPQLASTREKFRARVEAAEPAIVALIARESDPPCISRAYVHYAAVYNVFTGAASEAEDWPFERGPERNAAPYSLAYIERWYDTAHQGEPAAVDEAEKLEEDERAVVIGGRGVVLVKPAVMMRVWSTIMSDEDGELAKGLGPFEIVIPDSRDFSKVFCEDVDRLGRLLADVSRVACGMEAVVVCKIGDAIRPTTVSLSGVLGVDLTRNPGFRARFRLAWNALSYFGREVVKEDVNIRDSVRTFFVKSDICPYGSFDVRYEELKELWPDLEERRRRMTRVRAAQTREMDRLAEEIWSKLLEAEGSSTSRLAKLGAFVEDGDESIPLSRRPARAHVAERLHGRLAVDLVKEIVVTSPDSWEEKEGRIKNFVLGGDTRLPSLEDAFSRLEIAEQACPLPDDGSGASGDRSRRLLGQIRIDAEMLRNAKIDRNTQVAREAEVMEAARATRAAHQAPAAESEDAGTKAAEEKEEEAWDERSLDEGQEIGDDEEIVQVEYGDEDLLPSTARDDRFFESKGHGGQSQHGWC